MSYPGAMEHVTKGQADTGRVYEVGLERAGIDG